MALRCRRTNNCAEIWCLVASGGVDIWVSWPSFQKSNIGWPQQPPAEKVLKSVKNWIFDDEFHKNWQLLVILVPGMILPSRSVIFLIKWGCKVHIEIQHLFCWRLLRPTNVTFLKTGRWNISLRAWFLFFSLAIRSYIVVYARVFPWYFRSWVAIDVGGFRWCDRATTHVVLALSFVFQDDCSRLKGVATWLSELACCDIILRDDILFGWRM